MRETFRNVSIFLMFLASLLIWHAAGDWVGERYFSFRYGQTVLLCLWSTSVVILFHLLYHYFGKMAEKTVYVSTILALIAVGTLVYLDKLPVV